MIVYSLAMLGLSLFSPSGSADGEIGYGTQTIPPEIGKSKTKKTVDDLEQSLRSPDPATRRLALQALGDTDIKSLQDLSSLVRSALRDKDAWVRMNAAGVIGSKAGTKVFPESDQIKAFELVVGGLADADDRTRSSALGWLDQFVDRRGSLKIPNLSKVIVLMDEPNQWFQFEDRFLGFDVKNDQTVADLLTSLKSPETRTQARAATLLGMLGKAAMAAVPGLIAQLRSPDRDAAVAAQFAIRRISPSSVPRHSPVARFILAEAAKLDEPDMIVGVKSLKVICQIGGEDATTVMPAILRYAHRCSDASNPMAQEFGPVISTWLMREYFGAPLPPALLAEIRDDRPEAAAVACILIGNGKEAYSDLVPQMIDRLDRTTGAVQRSVASALGSIGRKDRRALDALIRVYERSNVSAVRIGVIEGFRGLDRPTPEVLRILQAARHDDDPKIRDAASLTTSLLEGPPSGGGGIAPP